MRRLPLLLCVPALLLLAWPHAPAPLASRAHRSGGSRASADLAARSQFTGSPDSLRFGIAAALSGDGLTALVGGDDQVSVFRRAGRSEAFGSRPVAVLTGRPGADFGGALAISADGATLLIGADWENRAYIYTAGRSPSAPPILAAVLPDPDPAARAYARFGVALALSADGRTALVSASEQGRVYRYGPPWGGASPVRPQQVLLGPAVPTVPGGDEGFGPALALSSDGRLALVGEAAREQAYPWRRPVGSARFAARPAATLLDPGPAQVRGLNAGFGQSVALAGDGRSALVATEGAGIVYRYALQAGGTGTTPAATELVRSGRYGLGHSLALDGAGRTAVVGDIGKATAAAYRGIGLPAPPGPVALAQGADEAGLGPGGDFGLNSAVSADGRTAMVGETAGNTVYVYDLGGAGA